jgi:hypothetical protein
MKLGSENSENLKRDQTEKNKIKYRNEKMARN